MRMSPVRGCRVDLRTCDWHPEQRHCVAKGNRKCRPWDSSNAREILKHAHAYKSKGLFGFELGNELAAGGGTVSGDRTPGAHPDRCRAWTLLCLCHLLLWPFLSVFVQLQGPTFVLMWLTQHGRPAEAMLSYFEELQSMVAEIWADTPAAQRPKIIGPDNDFDPGHTNVSATLGAMAPFLHAFTYHK